jgi:hypothetical protein
MINLLSLSLILQRAPRYTQLWLPAPYSKHSLAPC